MSTIQFAPQTLGRVTVSRGELRLTRRGRVVVFLLGLVAVLAVGLALAGGSFASAESGSTTTVTVGTGDTLWEIASEASGDEDVRAMIARIQELNDLDSSVIIAGQRLQVPQG